LAFSEVLTAHATADSGYLGEAARNHHRDVILLLAAAELLNGFQKLEIYFGMAMLLSAAQEGLASPSQA